MGIHKVTADCDSGGRGCRGEVWWALVEQRCPVVLLSWEEGAGFRAMRVVAPATAAEKRGFVVLSGEEASEPGTVQRSVGEAGPEVRAAGVEVEIGSDAGLSGGGVVRVALPRDGHVFCTWLVTLPPDHLLERVGALQPATLDRLGNALRLAGIEQVPTSPTRTR